MSRLDELRKVARCGDDITDRPYDAVDGLITMIEYAKPKTVLEIGSDRGVSTEVFLNMCEHVTAVDPWAHIPERHDDFLRHCAKYPNLKIIRGYSPEALDALPDASFDLVYIDAVHTYDGCIIDARASHRLVKAGGWMAGHDYLHPFNEQDVIPAVDALFGRENLTIFADSSWLARRPDVLRETPPNAYVSPSDPDMVRP